MPSADAIARLEPIIRDLFDEYDGPVTADLTAKDIPQWDSLANVQLVVMVEKAFGVRFTTGEIGKLTNLGELVRLAATKAD